MLEPWQKRRRAKRKPTRQSAISLPKQVWVIPTVLYDRTLLFVSVALLLLGLVMVCSSSLAIAEYVEKNSFYFVIRHSIYLCISIVFGLLALRVDIQRWHRMGGTLLLISLGLLALVCIHGVGRSVNGSTRWLSLGPVTVQVSEIAKLFTIIYLAGYLVRRSEEVRYQIQGFLKPMIVLSLITGLLLLEPDFGAAAVIMATCLAMMFLAGARLWQFIVLTGAVLSTLAVLALASPYRLRRLTAFLDPWTDPYGSGYQLTQSLIAFGHGSWLGQGLGNSVQKLSYLPEAHTDFVFAVLAEELGLIGVLATLTLFGLLFVRAMRIGRVALCLNQPFAAFLAYGIGTWITLQALINMGVNSGLFPTKGITLPLVSYGGSSLVITTVAVAILLRVDYEMRKLLIARKEEAAEKWQQGVVA